MEKHLIKAQYYHDQAINMRTLAAQEGDLEVRKAYISIAEGYEKLWLEAIDEAMDLAEQHHDQPVFKFRLQ
jgi:hypothetical protein